MDLVFNDFIEIQDVISYFWRQIQWDLFLHDCHEHPIITALLLKAKSKFMIIIIVQGL